MSSPARSLIVQHAAAQPRERRRALGSHATPAPLAEMLVELALGHLGRVPGRVLDPSCGAGSFLLAAADALEAHGVDPADVVGQRLSGCDVDPAAVVHCRAALRRWAVERGVASTVEPRVVVHDPLVSPVPFDGVDLVVGNPPFLAQRTSDTARTAAERDALRSRFGDLGPYVDAAAAFLLVATEALVPGGVAVLIEPHSVLSVRDASAVRDLVSSRAELIALWADDVRHFDAEVHVCAPVLRRRVERRTEVPTVITQPDTQVELRWGASCEVVATAAPPGAGMSWAPLLAAALGVPAVSAVNGRRSIGHVATCTAGFRDEFYALAAAARESGDVGDAGADDVARPPLVTVGMIDVCRLDRVTPRRLGGRRLVEPLLDRAALELDRPAVASWVDARLVPKVLVATQTRIPEAVADPTGDLVPVTPVISVTPLVETAGGEGPPVDVWHLAAALSAPTIAVAVASQRAGSGLSTGALRLSASTVRDLPLPTDVEAWKRGAAVARALHSCRDAERSQLLRQLGTTMCEAYGQDADPAVTEWWLERADRRRPRR